MNDWHGKQKRSICLIDVFLKLGEILDVRPNSVEVPRYPSPTTGHTRSLPAPISTVTQGVPHGYGSYEP